MFEFDNMSFLFLLQKCVEHELEPNDKHIFSSKSVRCIKISYSCLHRPDRYKTISFPVVNDVMVLCN